MAFRKAFLVVLGACMASTFVSPVLAGPGQDYGTRDPATCAARSAPKSGGPSAQQAAQYVACTMEQTAGENIFLFTNIQTQVAPKGRPFNPVTDSATGIDPSQQVYDIRGSFRGWQCSAKHSLSYTEHPGKACNYEDYSDLKGICWKDTFADWHCELAYTYDFRKKVEGVAPPP